MHGLTLVFVVSLNQVVDLLSTDTREELSYLGFFNVFDVFASFSDRALANEGAGLAKLRHLGILFYHF
jgi:hypothetical protein